MTYASIGRFKCDGCRVNQSEPIEIPSDLLAAEVPIGWLRIETLQRTHDLDVRGVHHYCRSCAKLIESYLAGRRLEDEERIEADGR